MLGPVGSGLALVLVWIVGSGLSPRRPPAERLATGVVALLALVWTTLWQPVLGFSWFSHGRLLPLVPVAVLVAAALRVRAWRARPRIFWPAVAAWALPTALLCMPLATGAAAHLPIPDMRWHEGWMLQVEGGLREPSGVYAGVPNGYPWLYHALGAWLGLLPGGLVGIYWALQLFASAALALGVWLVARRLGLDELPAAVAVAIALGAAGVGWLWVHEPTAVLYSKDLARGHGDFAAVAPPATPALGELPLILPRDLAISLLPLGMWFVLRALASGGAWDAGLAGAMVGMLLLTGPVAGVVAILVAAPLLLRRPAAVRSLVVGTLAAGVVAGVWAVPLLIHYRELGGFAATEPRPSVSVPDALVGMGLVVPLGAIGLLAMRRASARAIDREAMVVLAAVPALLCVLAAGFPGNTIAGIAPLARLQRYLPFLPLALAFPAAFAVTSFLRRRPVPVRAALGLALALALAASTALTAVALGDTFSSAPDVGVRCAGGSVRPGDVVAVAGLGRPADRIVGDALFRSTGAWVFWHPGRATQVRYRRFASPARQAVRRDLTAALSHGGPTPAGVRWVLLPGEAEQPGGAVPAGSCVVDAHHERFVVRLYEATRTAAP